MSQKAELVEKLADTVYMRGLSAPAIFLLEMYRPFSGIFYNLSMAMYPALNAIFGFGKLKDLSEVMRTPSDVEKLITLIEEKIKGRTACRE